MSRLSYAIIAGLVWFSSYWLYGKYVHPLHITPGDLGTAVGIAVYLARGVE